MNLLNRLRNTFNQHQIMTKNNDETPEVFMNKIYEELIITMEYGQGRWLAKVSQTLGNDYEITDTSKRPYKVIELLSGVVNKKIVHLNKKKRLYTINVLSVNIPDYAKEILFDTFNPTTYLISGMISDKQLRILHRYFFDAHSHASITVDTHHEYNQLLTWVDNYRSMVGGVKGTLIGEGNDLNMDIQHSLEWKISPHYTNNEDRIAVLFQYDDVEGIITCRVMGMVYSEVSLPMDNIYQFSKMIHLIDKAIRANIVEHFSNSHTIPMLSIDMGELPVFLQRRYRKELTTTGYFTLLDEPIVRAINDQLASEEIHIDVSEKELKEAAYKLSSFMPYPIVDSKRIRNKQYTVLANKP